MVFKTVSPGGPVVLAVLGTMGLGLLFQIIGTATDGWASYSRDYGYGIKGSLDMGLWKITGSAQGVSQSYDLPADDWCSAAKSMIRAAQALSIIGILISVAYLAFAVMDQVKQMVPILPLGGALLFLLFVFSLTTWAVFLSSFNTNPCDDGPSISDQGASLGYSFFLYLFGSLISVGGCAVHLVMRSIKGNAGGNSFDTQLQAKLPVGESEAGYKMQG